MGKILKTSAEGRKCSYPDCTHSLSIYNHEVYCHLHLDAMAEKQKLKFLPTVPLDVETHKVGDDFSV
jgi:hypothetical protein